MSSGIFDTTIGGTPSRSVVYAKLLEHIREAQECAALMAHLCNTEGSDMDKLLAKGWLGMSELYKMNAHVITQMAMSKLS